MRKVYVSTLNPRAYHAIISMLKTAKIGFSSVIPGEPLDPEALVLTTRQDLELYKTRNFILLDEIENDPLLLGCQLYCKMRKNNNEISLGVDPGKRIGIALKLGDTYLGATNLDSSWSLIEFIKKLVFKFPEQSIRVKVGDGDLGLANRLRLLFGDRITVEVVDESGTSGVKNAGMTKDQSAAVRILSKKGRSWS
jgi:hypothetical protein